MAINLSDFQISETGYVAKMNANNQAIRDYFTQSETGQANVAASAVSVSAMQRAIFGASPAIFTENSYRASSYGSDLTVSAGTAWAPSQNLVVSLPSGTTVSMIGQPSGTYYVNAVNGDPITQPVISTSPRDALWTFGWNGSSISGLTRLATIMETLPRGPETVPYAATVALDWSDTNTLRLRLTGNAAISSCSGGIDGQRCMLEVTQDSTGGRQLTLGTTSIKVGSDVGWAIDLTPNRRTRIGLVRVGPSSVYDLAAVARGF
jgi:hypothetical protein